MQNASVDTTYIIDSIRELTEFLPIRPPAPVSDYYSLLRAGQENECIERIASYLNLPIKINLVYVARNETSANQFQSRDVVTTNDQGRGRGCIAAQVVIPPMLPLYGSSRFRNLPFTVQVDRSCVDRPQEFVTIMAHELTHIVLHSLWYSDRHNEIKTDLATMVLGFRDVMKYARTITYLSDEQFDCAYKEICRLHQNGQNMVAGVTRDVADVHSALARLQEQMVLFQARLELLDKWSVTRIDGKDGLRLVSFHTVGFLDDFKIKASTIKSRCDAIDLEQLQPHGKAGTALIQQTKEALHASYNECQQLIAEMAENNRIITKYLGPVHKLLSVLSGGTWLPRL